MTNINKYIAEYLGTFLFLTCILASGGNFVVVGMALAISVYFAGSISGGHINPATSIAMYFNNKLAFNNLIGYIISQITGGISAVYLYNLVMKM